MITTVKKNNLCNRPTSIRQNTIKKTSNGNVRTYFYGDKNIKRNAISKVQINYECIFN